MNQLIALNGKVIIREDLPNGGTREAEICPVTRCVLWWQVNGPNEEETPVGGQLFNPKSKSDENVFLSPVFECQHLLHNGVGPRRVGTTARIASGSL
jgi:hypothetical protein